MGEAFWLLCEGSSDSAESHSLFSTQLIFLLSSSPPAGAALSLSPGILGTLFWKKDASHPWSPGMLGTATQKATSPQRGSVAPGGNGHGGEGLVGKSAAPGPEPALLGSLRDAPRLDSCDTNRMGCAATANEGIWDGAYT